MMEKKTVKAICHSIRTSPRKLNLVAQTIRGLNAEKAVAELTFSKKRIAKVALGVLQSAIANAENNHQLNIDKLYVREAYVGKGMVMKRVHARGRGRSARVLKPFSNLTVVVAEREE
jgi:large subunit ribosomal protein L22